MSDCVKIEGRKYDVVWIRITSASLNKEVAIPPNTNSWMVENYGTVTATINNRPLLPPPAPGLSGESFGVSGNDGDIFDGQLSVAMAAAGGDVWFSFYVYKK